MLKGGDTEYVEDIGPNLLALNEARRLEARMWQRRYLRKKMYWSNNRLWRRNEDAKLNERIQEAQSRRGALTMVREATQVSNTASSDERSIFRLWIRWHRDDGWNVEIDEQPDRTFAFATKIVPPSVMDYIEMEKLMSSRLPQKKGQTEDIVEAAIIRNIAAMANGLSVEAINELYKKYRSFDFLMSVIRVMNAFGYSIMQAEEFMQNTAKALSEGAATLEIGDNGVRMVIVRSLLVSDTIPLPGNLRKAAEDSFHPEEGANDFLND